MHLHKTKAQKEENTSSLPPSARVRLWFPQGARSVRDPSHSSSILSQWPWSVPLLKILQNSPSCHEDLMIVGWWLGVSITRWAGCLCPCATRRELSPCPSGGLNWDPLGCTASAPRHRTSGAQASNPVRTSRRSPLSHLEEVREEE